MGYEVVTSGGVIWLVDWKAVEKLNRSYHIAVATKANHRRRPATEGYTEHPSIAPIESIVVDWPKVRATVTAESRMDLERFKGPESQNMPALVDKLRGRIIEARQMRKEFDKLLLGVHRKNDEKMKRDVANAELGIAVSTFIRDYAFDGIMLAATLTPAGTAARVLMGGGAMLKGVAKYQDTGSIGAASMTFAGEIAFGMIKVKWVKDSVPRDYVLTVVKGGYETATSYAAGDDLAKAVTDGGLKILGEGGATFLGNTAVGKKILEMMPIPGSAIVEMKMPKVLGRAFNGTQMAFAAKTYAKEMAKGTLGTVLGDVLGLGLDALLTDKKPVWAGEAMDGPEAALNMAIINTSKGLSGFM